MEFSIITPSLNQLSFLKTCHASIQDQKNIEMEHIVVDGNSCDGTVEWLEQNPDIVSISEKDNGMYDAVNKGFRIAQGDFLAYLNCDEQYLPGTLEWVKDSFHRHPEADLLFGDALLIRPDGSLLAYWKGYAPRWRYILSSYLYLLTATMFIRRKVIHDGFIFDPKFKSMGDAEYIVRLLRSGRRIRHEGRFLAAYTMTGANKSRWEAAGPEKNLLKQQYPDFPFHWSKVINLIRLAEKFVSGAYFLSKPLSYSVFPQGEHPERKTFHVTQASPKWRYIDTGKQTRKGSKPPL